MSPSKFAKLTARVLRARNAYEKARDSHAQHPAYKCRQERLKKSAQRLSRTVLNATAALLPAREHLR